MGLNKSTSPPHQCQALSPAFPREPGPVHSTPMNRSTPPPSPGDKNMGGRVLDGPEQGQAEEGILLDAADILFQDLFRSCVTRGTRVQEVDPRYDRGSNPLWNPGDLEVDPAVLMNLLCTSLSGWKHSMLHWERRTSASTGHLLLLHGLKFHHHHLLFVGYIWLSICSFICNQPSWLQKYISIPVQPIIITVRMGTSRFREFH